MARPLADVLAEAFAELGQLPDLDPRRRRESISSTASTTVRFVDAVLKVLDR
jgi:hypothetical protein